MKLKCLVVDDDVLLLNIMQEFLKQIPYVDLCGTFDNAVSVYNFLKIQSVDILFLDIEMPNLNGIEFLKSLENPPTVVLITSSADYALMGYELSVFDYILKPITFERILKPIHKLFDLKISRITESNSKRRDKFLYLRENKKMIKVEFKNILYIESVKDYLKVVSRDKTVTTKMTIGYLESFLNPEMFIRVHKSFIISVRHIDSYDNMCVEMGKVQIPIGRTYKDDVMKKLEFLHYTL
jgi:DNA-binding LytR/AlgR family response regulator